MLWSSQMLMLISMALVVTKLVPNGERTMTIDNSPWVQRIANSRRFRQMEQMGNISWSRYAWNGIYKRR